MEYNENIPDLMEVEKNITISDIQSYTNVTDDYEKSPFKLDWGERYDRNKWKIISQKGTFTIGFDHYDINATDPKTMNFSRIVTEQIGIHTEAKYKDEWKPFQFDGRTIKKNEEYIVKLTAYKKAETGDFSIKTIPIFDGIEEDRLTWWNGSWKYRIDNFIPDGPRPYQLSLTLSNLAGMNDATHVFLNGHAKPDFSDIRFTLNNATPLPYWIESNTGKVWINVTGNGVLNLYYGNPSASDLSNGKNTFEFFEDFSTLNLGSNPVLSPSQTWESGGNLRWGSIACLNGIYYIYYTNGADAASDIGRATSTDLINWDKAPGNPVILKSIGPSILKETDGITPVYYNNKYWMLTMKSNGAAIELRSAPAIDSDVWTLENANLINPVSGSWYDNYVFTTSFIRENGIYYIYLEGRDSGLKWNTGYFTAFLPSGPFVERGVLLTPTFSWEETGILDPEMRKFGNTFYLFYTGGITKPTYSNSYASSSNPGGAYTKSQVQITPLGQTYPAILAKDSYYYILTDDHMSNFVLGTGKNLYKRKDLNGMFGSPFDWNKGGSPTISGGELLINQDGEYIRSARAFFSKAIEIRAKFAPESVDNSYQYIGFAANQYGGDLNSLMFVSSDGNFQASSGNSANVQNTNIYDENYFGSYHNYKVLWRNGEAKFLIDDTLKATHTTYVADTSQPIGIYDYATNSDLFVDWMFVRNYISPEPALVSWTKETGDSSDPPTPISISFIDPTPPNGSTISENYVLVNTSMQSAYTTAFIDWDGSLVAWWRFNNEQGETFSLFKDGSSNGNDGTCSGSSCPTSTSGKFGTALNFDGSNDYLNAGSIASGTSGTTLVWINPGGDYTNGQAVMNGLNNIGSDVSSRFSIIAKSNDCPSGDWSTSIGNGGTSQNICSGQVYNSVNFPQGTWKQMAVTYNGSVVNMYLDDVLVKSIAQTVSGAGSAQPYAIGRLGGYNGYYFNGKIDEARIFGRALSYEEIKASYNTGMYRLYRNFTDLPDGAHDYTAYVQNLSGTVDHTETRTVTTSAIISGIPGVTDPSSSHEIPDDTDNNPLWGEIADLFVTVTDDTGIEKVTVDLSGIGGPASRPMINNGGNIWTATTNAIAGTYPKIYDLPINATNIMGKSNTGVSIALRVMKNGDTTGNGVLNIGDALRCANNVSMPGNPAYTLSSPYVADLNGNGAVNIGDCLRLANNISLPGNPLYILK